MEQIVVAYGMLITFRKILQLGILKIYSLLLLIPYLHQMKIIVGPTRRIISWEIQALQKLVKKDSIRARFHMHRLE